MTENERIDAIAGHIRQIIELLGDDTGRQGLLDTPVRAAKALAYLTSGYAADAAAVVGKALFAHDGSQMVIVKDIEFYSLCEHHVLPFFGKVSIAYIPDGKIIGLSKLARLAEVFARRLQVQERLTEQIATATLEATGAKGVIVLVEGEHMCMKMRGVEKQHSSTTTMHYNGAFADDPLLRREFLDAVK